MDTIPWVVWLILAIVIAVVIAVIVLFVTKGGKTKPTPGPIGPQGLSGNRGSDGVQGALGHQGISGGPGILLSQLPVTLSFETVANMKFPNDEIKRNCAGVLTAIGNMLTLEFSQIPIVMTTPLTSEFAFLVNLPSGFQLSTTNPIQLFSGVCLTNRQNGVNSTPIYLSLITIVSGNAGLRLFYQSQDGLIWNGDGGTTSTPLLLCDFSITLLLA